MSYKRLDQLYLCVIRAPFLTVIAHWAILLHQGSQADFVQMEIAMTPMIK